MATRLPCFGHPRILYIPYVVPIQLEGGMVYISHKLIVNHREVDDLGHAIYDERV